MRGGELSQQFWSNYYRTFDLTCKSNDEDKPAVGTLDDLIGGELDITVYNIC
jgi:hypothetical protein